VTTTCALQKSDKRTPLTYFSEILFINIIDKHIIFYCNVVISEAAVVTVTEDTVESSCPFMK